MSAYRVLLVLCTGVVSFVTVRAQTSVDESHARAQIANLEHQTAEAVSRGDWAWVHGTEASDFQLVDPDGNWLHGRAAAQNEETNTKGIKQQYTDLSVRIYGNTAVAIYKNNQTSASNGRDMSESYIETDVWVKRGNDWKLVSAQLTRVAGK